MESTILSSDPSSMHSFGTSTQSTDTNLKREKGEDNLEELLDGDSNTEENTNAPKIVHISLPNGMIKRKMSPKEFLEGLQPVVVVKKMTNSEEWEQK